MSERERERVEAFLKAGNKVTVQAGRPQAMKTPPPKKVGTTSEKEGSG